MKKIYLIAAVMAVITAIATYSFINSLQNTYKSNLVKVVVAVRQIPQKTVVTAEMITMKEIPKEAVNKLTATKIEDVKGRITKETIEENEQVFLTRLSEQGKDESSLEYVVPDGKRAITVQVDEIAGVAGNLVKGNRVDVVATMVADRQTAAGKEKVPVSMMVVENIEVLAAGMKSAKQDDNQTKYNSVTLAVTPDEAVRLNYASTDGKLKCILRPALDKRVVSPPAYVPAV